MNIKRRLIEVMAVAVVFALFAVLTAGCGYDPHEGMVEVPDGSGGNMWVPLYDDLPVSSFTSDSFSSDGEYIVYDGGDYTALRGIDVSEHQQEIDWDAVKNDGVDFAIIRAGYRGYSEGQIYEDQYFRANMEGALAAGIRVGVYFFSQAVTADEAREEAEYLLELISGYEFDLPVFYDWEPIYGDDSRTETVDSDVLTECCLTFCSVLTDAGYEAGVYFNRSLGYTGYELDELSGITFWAAATGDYPDFYYAHSFWQYSYDARIDGIDADTDLDLMFVPNG